MKILVVHEVNYLRKVVIEFQEIPETLARRGHDVTFVDFGEGDGAWPPFHLRTRVWKNVHRLPPASSEPDPGITLLRPPTINVPGLDRLVAIATHAIFFERTLQSLRPDVILLYSAPTNGVSLLRVAKRLQIPVVFRTIDVLSHFRSPWTRPIVYWAERYVLRHSDRVSALTPALARHAVALGARPENVSIRGPAVQTDLFAPGPSDPAFRAAWNLPLDAKIVIFAGTFFPFSGLDDILRQAPYLFSNVPEAFLLFLGAGQLTAKLQATISSSSHANRMRIIPFQPFSEVPRFLREASLAICPFQDHRATRDNFPHKIIQYLSCGLPTLATPMPGTRDIFSGEAQGVVYKPIEEFGPSIVSLLQNETKRNALARAARAAIEERFTVDAQATDMEVLLQSLLKPLASKTRERAS